MDGGRAGMWFLYRAEGICFGSRTASRKRCFALGRCRALAIGAIGERGAHCEEVDETAPTRVWKIVWRGDRVDNGTRGDAAPRP